MLSVSAWNSVSGFEGGSWRCLDEPGVEDGDPTEGGDGEVRDEYVRPWLDDDDDDGGCGPTLSML